MPSGSSAAAESYAEYSNFWKLQEVLCTELKDLSSEAKLGEVFSAVERVLESFEHQPFAKEELQLDAERAELQRRRSLSAHRSHNGQKTTGKRSAEGSESLNCKYLTSSQVHI